MRYLINQPRGLGDILFCEPLARHLIEKDNSEVIWVIHDEFYWIQEYIPYIQFKKTSQYPIDFEKDSFGEYDGMQFLPLRFANPIVRNLSSKYDCSDQLHTMLDKYRLLNLSTDLWKTLKWNRNFQKENLLYNLLNLQEPYILINEYFSGGKIDINLENDFANKVYMTNIPGYTLLDWSKIIENAEEIHTVSTSNLFMIETLPIKATKIHIYNRTPIDTNLDGIREFVNPKFILHE